jgi:hypothetical protein
MVIAGIAKGACGRPWFLCVARTGTLAVVGPISAA